MKTEKRSAVFLIGDAGEVTGVYLSDKGRQVPYKLTLMSEDDIVESHQRNDGQNKNGELDSDM